MLKECHEVEDLYDSRGSKGGRHQSADSPNVDQERLGEASENALAESSWWKALD
jgi:hypothetical protein